MTNFLSSILSKLLILSSFVLYLHASEVKLTVTNDPSSRVNGYYPFAIEFTIDREYLAEGSLIIRGVDLGTKDCLSMINYTDPPNFFLACNTSLNNLQLTIDPSWTNQTYDIDLLISFVQAKYNEKMTPRLVSVGIMVPNGKIIMFSNKDDWTPQYPALFERITVNPSTGIPTCQLTTFAFTLIPSATIFEGSKIELTFDSNFDFSFTTSTELNNLHVSSGTITGNITDEYPASGIMKIELRDIRRMSLVSDLYVKIRTYSLDDYIVHEESVKVLIIPEIINFPRGITLIRNKGVCSKGTYRFAVSSRCGPIPNAKYSIIPPSSLFDNEEMTISSSRNLLEEEVIEIELVNPCAIIPGLILSKENFNVTVYNGYTNKAAFTTLFQLPSDTSYEPGKLTNFKVTPEYLLYGYDTPYIFSFNNEHLIPLGSTITLTLNPFVELVSIQKATINEVDTVVAYLHGSLSVSVPMDILPSTEIKIIIGNLRNPTNMDIYSGFIAHSFNTLGYGIDTSDYTSVTIDKPGIATVTCEVSNKQNLELAVYSFTFSSAVVKFNADTILGIKIPGEIDASSCLLLDNEEVSSLGNEVFDYWLKLKDITVVDSVTMLKFKFSCKNPATLRKTGSFLLVLFKSSGHKVLTGEVKVKNEKGAVFASGSSIECDKTCPRCHSLCTLTLNRKTNTGIRSITIINDRLDLNTLNCKYEGSDKSECIAPTNKADIRIKIISNIIEKTFSMRINNISLIYPDYSDILGYPIKVLTYTTEEENAENLVEEDEVGVIYGECDYPCKSCSKAHNICDTCTEDIKDEQPFYLYPEGFKRYNVNCIKLQDNFCFNGYYKDEINKECRKCSEDCKECERERDNCVVCKNSSKILYKGKCIDECDEGVYLNNNSCESCNEGCKTCVSLTECLECYEDYKFLAREKRCVLECPKGTYIEGNNCSTCDKNCAACDGSSSKCTECRKDVPRRYLSLTTSKCIDKATCESFGLIADDSRFVCGACDNNCKECRGRIDYCTECKDNKYLNITEGVCLETCTPYAYNKEGIEGVGGKCVHCENNCGTCNSDTECITCIPNTLFITATKQCSTSCPRKYYEKNSHCYPCNDLCESCNDNNECASCIEGYFLYKGQCYLDCPLGTFNSISRVCEDCNESCLACESNKYSCTQCTPDYLISNDQCVGSCSQGTILIDSKCEPCSSSCLDCAESIDSCTACHGDYYLYEDKCLSECPENTTGSLKGQRTCVPCMAGCKRCYWKRLNDPYPERCSACLPGYKYLNFKCYLTCPKGFIDNTNGLSCIEIDIEENQSKNFLPFPHVIFAGLLAFIIILRQTGNRRVLIISNIVVMLNYIAISSYVFIFLYSDYKIRAMICLVLFLQLTLNVIFLAMMYKKFIVTDVEFVVWSDNHCCVKYCILFLSTIFTFQTIRLLYSRFMGLEVLLVRFKDFKNIFKSVKHLSLVQLTLIQGGVIFFGAVGVFRLDYGTTSYFLILESVILSSLLFMLLGYEVTQAKNIVEILENAKENNEYVVVERNVVKSRTKNSTPSYSSGDIIPKVEGMNSKHEVGAEREEEKKEVMGYETPRPGSMAYIYDNTNKLYSNSSSQSNMKFLATIRDEQKSISQESEMSQNAISNRLNHSDSNGLDIRFEGVLMNEPKARPPRNFNEVKNKEVAMCSINGDLGSNPDANLEGDDSGNYGSDDKRD